MTRRRRAGLAGHGTAFQVRRADGGKDAGQIGARAHIGGVAKAFGGDFESRLVLLAKPQCVLSTPDCGPATTRVAFDGYARTVSETDGNGNTARTAYNPPTGWPDTVTGTETNALSHTEVTTLEPDRQQPAGVRDANDQVTTNSYDALGRLIAVRMSEQAAADPPAKQFSYFMDPGHAKAPLVTTRELQSGTTFVTTWAFLDSLGRDRQTQQISPASTSGAQKTIVVDTRYDDTGHVAAESLPVVVDGAAGTDLLAVPGIAVDEIRRSYDELGRDVRSAQFAGGRELWTTTSAYFGDHTRTTLPAGGVVSTSWTDVRDRLVRRQEGTGSGTVSTTYTYTPADKIATITDPSGHRTAFDYDLQKRPITSTNGDSGPSRTRYDNNGNVAASFDAKTLAAGGSTPTLSTDYDAVNRPFARWSRASGTGTKVAASTYGSIAIPNGIGRDSTQTPIQDGKSYTKAALGCDPRGRHLAALIVIAQQGSDADVVRMLRDGPTGVGDLEFN